MKTQEIKRGTFEPYYEIKKLKMASVNRDIFTKHSENFKGKLNEFGWMMPIVVSSNNDVIEGHHRLESAKLLKQKTIPVYIVDWINTNKKQDHLGCIIGLNNGNRAWTPLDYLKAFSTDNKDYKIVWDAYNSNSNNVSVGNVIKCYFAKSNKNIFTKGKSKIKNIKFAEFLIKNFSSLYEKYPKKVTAYCVRELINIGYVKAKEDFAAMNYLFNYYEKMAKNNHSAISSITDFRPLMELYLNEYYTIKNNESNR